MSNYFRVTAYHESENISVIIDSNGYFAEIWELSALMIQKGFRVLEVSDSSQFLDGNIEKADKDAESLIVLAVRASQPITATSLKSKANITRPKKTNKELLRYETYTRTIFHIRYDYRTSTERPCDTVRESV